MAVCSKTKAQGNIGNKKTFYEGDIEVEKNLTNYRGINMVRCNRRISIEAVK